MHKQDGHRPGRCTVHGVYESRLQSSAHERGDRQLEGADLVITGEGRIDSQSADGKVVSGVARRTRAKGVPLIAIAGGIADSAGAVYDIGVSAMFSTDRAALPVDMLGARSPGDYEATLSDIMSLIAIAERFA